MAVSTLYASWHGRSDYGSADGEVRDWWVVSDAFTIDVLGEVVFALTIIAAFLISFESYINAKARRPLTSPEAPTSNLARRTATRPPTPGCSRCTDAPAPNDASHVRSPRRVGDS